MAVKSGTTLDTWRNYFRTPNSDIFEIIEHAIMVAAADCPQEFRLRRVGIAEILFSSKLNRCIGCDRVELSVSGGGDEGCKSRLDRRDGCGFEAGGGVSKESKVDGGGRYDDQVEMNMMNPVSSYGEAVALTDEIEEESQIAGEVLRIKEILDNSQNESDSELLDLLKRLQLMALSVDTLKVTEIGKSVNALRKHGSKQIRDIAKTLIEMWKAMVDEWVSSTVAIAGAEGTPESVNPSVVDEEEGLPSPPLDEGYFFTPQPTSIELSEFFDAMDDDGNPRNRGEFNKNKKGEEMKKKQEPSVLKKQVAVVKPHKPSNAESGPKVRNETIFQQKSDKAMTQKKPLAAQQDKPKCLDEAARLEVAKRKLHERYQQAENAKRQRTIRVMELHDLPKQAGGHKNAHMKPGNNNRHRANGRH